MTKERAIDMAIQLALHRVRGCQCWDSIRADVCQSCIKDLEDAVALGAGSVRESDFNYHHKWNCLTEWENDMAHVANAWHTSRSTLLHDAGIVRW